MPSAGGRLDAVALCILEGLGVRYEVARALSALEANDPYEKPVVRSSLSEVLLTEGLRYTPLQQGPHHLGL